MFPPALRTIVFVVPLAINLLMSHVSQAQDIPLPKLGQPLTDQQVQLVAELVLAGIDREFPNKPGIVLAGPESILSPRQMFPAFFGCFDWHSAVHGHWVLVRLLRKYPDSPLASRIRSALDEHLSAAHLQQEADFFAADVNKTFERMYGWAWLFRLALELDGWDDPQGRMWRDNLRPLEQVLIDRTLAYLPLLQVPIRSGEHFDTAFALGHILDYARGVGHSELEELVVRRSREFFLADRNYPYQYEPSGHDFYSPGWNEADLMRRVLSRQEFADWLTGFLPDLNAGDLGPMSAPMKVSDVTDGKLVHLAGLDLARAACMQSIATALPSDDPRRHHLQQWAASHFEIGVAYVFSGHYEGEHWLATFMLWAMDL
ncbi:MAG TPA: DUF2891 domain-containing protein [Pirellulaceae bacterium]|nr:DUF2891 domain-containing protein [Pirellulaceae bacterium]